MNDLLNNIDGKATQAAVEDVLRQYRTYMLTTPEDLMPSITARYTLEMPRSPRTVEDAVIKKVEWETNYQRFLNWFGRGYSKLTRLESQIIYMAYMDDEPKYNYEVYTELRMSESKYYRIRRRALLKLAIGLGVEVYESEEDKT